MPSSSPRWTRRRPLTQSLHGRTARASITVLGNAALALPAPLVPPDHGRRLVQTDAWRRGPRARHPGRGGDQVRPRHGAVLGSRFGTRKALRRDRKARNSSGSRSIEQQIAILEHLLYVADEASAKAWTNLAKESARSAGLVLQQAGKNTHRDELRHRRNSLIRTHQLNRIADRMRDRVEIGVADARA